MKDINESEPIIRIEKKIDEIIKYTMNPEDYKLKQSTNKKTKTIENRKTINKILYTLPQLEQYSELKDISNKDLEYMTDNYIEALMGTKNFNNMTEYSLFRDELKEKIRTKIFVNRVHNILDSYLNLKTYTKLDSSKRTEDYNIESLEIKKSILRRVYGYKLEEGETKVKSREQFAEQVGYTPRSIYSFQNELLDDLAPSFFGVNGLIL